MFVIIAAVSGCAVTGQHTGFLPESVGANPISLSYDAERPQIDIDDPAQATVIIYSHGTTRPQRQERCDRWWNRVPSALLNVESPRPFIYYLCSTATELGSREHAGRYVFARLGEVEAALDELLAAGVPSHRIFLAGHSAGGWVSLMAASAFPEKFNAAIAFAPAFAGRRSETSRFPWWRQRARPAQIARMVSAETLPALVFSYRGDPFNRPQDLTFLTEHFPESVELVAYGCPNHFKHLLHLYDCREVQTTDTLSRYLAKRLTSHKN